MASTTLSVTVKGGTTPVSIVINLFQKGIPLESFTRDGSFSHNFKDLQKGTYNLFIGGVNPLPSGTTTCELSQDEITLRPADASPAVRKGKKYLVQFDFTVK